MSGVDVGPWGPKFGQDLSAEPTGRPRWIGSRDDHDFLNSNFFGPESCDCGLNGHPFGADGAAVRGVLDVTAPENLAVFESDRGPDLVAAVRAMRVFPNLDRSQIQVVPGWASGGAG